VSWTLITNQWRLKLLAFGLAVLMLGAVAFSQNPPTIKSTTVQISYAVREGTILINPPSKVAVVYSGLADVIARVNTDNTTATVDATSADPGQAVRLSIRAQTTVPNVTVQQPAPIVVNIDTRAIKEVPVQVGYRAAPGWSVTRVVATCPGSSTPNPCKVHFDGPASWENNLTATVTLPGTVDVGSRPYLTQKILLGNSAGPLDITTAHTVPQASLDVSAVDVRVDATPGVTSSTVPLVDAPPSHGPPTGYRVIAITVSPLSVIITGDPAALSRIRYITLQAVDLSTSTADSIFQITVNYPPGITGTADIATVKYFIARNPNVG